MMDLDPFWDLIEQARQKIEASRGPKGYPLLDDCDALAQVLMSLSPDEIVQFDHRFDERIIAAYHWDLWAALAIVEDGYGDDAFEHFRAELILYGRQVFEAALQDPDTLADAGPGMEGLIYVPAQVYQQKTGREFPYEDDSDVPPHPKAPAGVRWEEEDLPSRLPRLWARFHEAEARAAERELAEPSDPAPTGQRVRVIDGELKNCEAVLIETDDATGDVLIAVPLFGRQTKVRLTKSQIELI